MAVLELTPQIRREIEDIVDKRIREAHITREDFSELKGIVRELGVRVNDLAVEVSDLTLDVKALAQAQKRT
ncbi:MAG: hypothetical protein AB1397_01290, partial [bacterium]